MSEAPTQGGRGGGAGRAARPWVLVAGGFHRSGGMDKANAALAEYLLARGVPLHLVAHAVAPEISSDASVMTHLVPRPAGSFLLGEQLLALKGRSVARAVIRRWPGARVVVNGGNCPWPDVNWVHSVHHAWARADEGAPFLFRARSRLAKALARGRELSALRAARIVIANSERTREDIIKHVGLSPARIRTVRLGGGAPEAAGGERAAARAWLGVNDGRPLVAFVGALGHDRNKGFDTLLNAWAGLCADPRWDADLVAAGGGRGFDAWVRRVHAAGLGGRVKLLGFTDRVGDVLAASDLLVSPVRYESYGLNVHEAICRGLPAMVSACAGVSEVYPPELSDMLLPHPGDAGDLARRLLDWRADAEGWRRRFAPLAAGLRTRTWADMAAEFVATVECAAAETEYEFAGPTRAPRAAAALRHKSR